MCSLDSVLTMISKDVNIFYLVEVGQKLETTPCSYSYSGFFSTSTLVLLMRNQSFVICSMQKILVGESALHVAR